LIENISRWQGGFSSGNLHFSSPPDVFSAPRPVRSLPAKPVPAGIKAVPVGTQTIPAGKVAIPIGNKGAPVEARLFLPVMRPFRSEGTGFLPEAGRCRLEKPQGELAK
jgi:hypothetical protein